jgi:AraC family transcriptional regulator of adaptative response / DNA-3-methyladenine glycosylase II
VGEWTAQYIALRQLREPDAFPASDLGLLRALADERGKRPSVSEVLERAESWRPWRAYAAQHLWMKPEVPVPRLGVESSVVPRGYLASRAEV